MDAAATRLAWLGALLAASVVAAPRSRAQPAPIQPAGSTADPSIGRVDVTLDLPNDKPYVGEMILLRMRSFIRADVVLDHIEQPPLLNFSWQQLGRDKPIQAMIGGFSVDGVERDLAIFPSTAGRLIIEPFTREVTVVTADNQRIATSFASKPVYVDVQTYAAISPPGRWWLPAKSLRLSETWSQVPDEIKPGTLTRRTVKVEASGLTADRLPPPPDMQTPGTIAFRGPVERHTILTENGPVARGTYVWDLRPVSPSPAKLPAIHIAWFDTQTRRMRDSALPETWVALVGTLVHPSHEQPHAIGVLSKGPLALGLAGFAWTAALIGLLATGRKPLGRVGRRRAQAIRRLCDRARFEDAAGMARALVALGRSDPERWAAVSSDPLVAPRLAAFDRAQFGRIREAPPPLRPLAADIRRLWRAAEPTADAAAGLAPLDAEAEAFRTSWFDRLWRRG